MSAEQRSVFGSAATAKPEAKPPSTTSTVRLSRSGEAPRLSLRYRFGAGQVSTHCVWHRLSRRRDSLELGSLDVLAPLEIRVIRGGPDANLRLSVGPLHYERSGDADSVTVEPAEGEARLDAELLVTRRGEVLRQRPMPGETPGMLGALFDALAAMDPLPWEPVGVGASWKGELANGEVRVESEVILTELHEASRSVTLRVHRSQSSGSLAPTLATGTWTVTDDWPPKVKETARLATPDSDRVDLVSTFALWRGPCRRP